MSALLLTKIVTAQLDNQTLQLCERTQEHGKLPYFAETMKFLQSECQILKRFQNRQQVAMTKEVNPKPLMKLANQKAHAATPTTIHQPRRVCNEEHRHYECPTSNKWIPAQRNAKAKELNLCYNCLQSGHRFSACPSNKMCLKCQPMINPSKHRRSLSHRCKRLQPERQTQPSIRPSIKHHRSKQSTDATYIPKRPLQQEDTVPRVSGLWYSGEFYFEGYG